MRPAVAVCAHIIPGCDSVLSLEFVGDVGG